jgi:1,4-dihydroxy-2-naphthoate octaprenyltransferase
MQEQIIRRILLHLRFPFSFFLLPVFLFALSTLPDIRPEQTLLLAVLLHLLVYPSSNGFNSLMDRDEGSIGGIERPPPVPIQMYKVSLYMDIAALSLALLYLEKTVVFLLSGYILASRAYSHRRIRLKRRPVIGFLTVSLFQGPAVYAMVVCTNTICIGSAAWWPGLATSFLLVGAGYPLTQVYQHAQDARDGVMTLSRLLGIPGTFLFSGLLFAALGLALGWYAWQQSARPTAAVTALLLLLSPVLLYFLRWAAATRQHPDNADFRHTMRMNLLGSTALNALFLTWSVLNHLPSHVR